MSQKRLTSFLAKLTVNETSLANCETTSVYSDDQNVDSFLSSETDLNSQGHKVEIPNEGKKSAPCECPCWIYVPYHSLQISRSMIIRSS